MRRRSPQCLHAGLVSKKKRACWQQRVYFVSRRSLLGLFIQADVRNRGVLFWGHHIRVTLLVDENGLGYLTIAKPAVVK